MQAHFLDESPMAYKRPKVEYLSESVEGEQRLMVD
jgi:hypothetical protein